MAKRTKRRSAKKVEQERKKRQRTLLVVGVVVVAVVVVGAMIILSTQDQPVRASLPTSVAGAGLQSGVTAEGYPYWGSPDAPVKIVEYSDYFCGHCGDYAMETAPRIEEAYLGTGEVQYINQYYALGKDARLSVVEAGACAADQGLFFEYQHLLFANQQELGSTAPEQWKNLLVQYAEQVGLDVPTFETCWDQGQHQREIVASIDNAYQKGISSTPTFEINGERLVGNQPYETFQAAIQRALAEAAQ